MTREEAIADLKSINATGMECIDYAIAVLEQLTSDDCVSRKDVLEMFGYETTIYDLPPVKPTHGTCKDCKYIRELTNQPFCEELQRYVKSDFYCRDFEK